MTRSRKILRLLLALFILALSCAGIFYHQVIRPKRIVQNLWQEDLRWSDEELRVRFHAATRWIPDHDSLLGLMRVGDESSIPILIRNLEQLEDHQGCSKEHCIDALKKITGENFGKDEVAWQQWAERND